MTNLRTPFLMLFVVIITITLPANARQGNPDQTRAQKYIVSAGARAVHSSSVSGPTSGADLQKMERGTDKEKIQELTRRVQQLDKEVAEREETSSADTVRGAIIAALIGAFAVLVTALIAFIGQVLMARREEKRATVAAQRALELSKQGAVFQQTERVLEFRLKQMEQFYGPMRALLEQSRGLYEKMLYELAQNEPERYRSPTNTSAQGSSLEVLDQDGTWKEFRLLDQLPAVRNSNPKAFALAEEILIIGEKMTKILSKRAGLASEEVVDILGQYMAHFATLSLIHKSGETKPYRPGWHPPKSYYPRELNPRIDSGYRELNQFLNEYVRASKRMLKAFPFAEGDGQQHQLS